MVKNLKAKTLTKLSEKENKLGYSYAKLKLTIKKYKKQLELLQDELKPIFENSKPRTNVLFFHYKNEIAGIQEIQSSFKGFDVTKFRDENPKLYSKYLVDKTRLEYKPIIQDEVLNAKQ